MSSHNGKRYPAEVKERTVRMVLEAQFGDSRDRGVIGRIARQLGVSGRVAAQLGQAGRGGLGAPPQFHDV
jgi:transposase-like protein